MDTVAPPLAWDRTGARIYESFLLLGERRAMPPLVRPLVVGEARRDIPVT